MIIVKETRPTEKEFWNSFMPSAQPPPVKPKGNSVKAKENSAKAKEISAKSKRNSAKPKHRTTNSANIAPVSDISVIFVRQYGNVPP